MPKKMENVVTYRVWYEPNPDYDGTFQVDKIGRGGLHATVTDAMGGLERAKREAALCKRWFNEEKILIEKAGPDGKIQHEVKTIMHDNVIVTLQKLVDGFTTEDVVSWEEEKVAKKKAKERETVPA